MRLTGRKECFTGEIFDILSKLEITNVHYSDIRKLLFSTVVLYYLFAFWAFTIPMQVATWAVLLIFCERLCYHVASHICRFIQDALTSAHMKRPRLLHAFKRSSFSGYKVQEGKCFNYFRKNKTGVYAVPHSSMKSVKHPKGFCAL